MTRIPGVRREFRLPWRSGADVRRDVEDELRFHLDMRARELVDAGMPPEEARAEAVRQFGDLDRTREYCRALDAAREGESRSAERFDALRHDLRYAARLLRKSPGFAAVAVLTLTLGIGATTAIFSVVDGVLLRPLPFVDPERIVTIWQHNRSSNSPREDVSPANFLDWQERSRSFAEVAAAEPFSFDVTHDGVPESLTAQLVSDGFFRILGVRAIRGRLFLADEYAAGGERVVMLGYDAWRGRFGADPSIVGRMLILDGEPRRVVGVLPPEFRFPVASEFWAPRVAKPEHRKDRGAQYLQVIARLKPGLSLRAAQADMDAVARQLAREYPRTNAEMGATVVALPEQMVGHVRRALLVLLGAVAFVLLIACANVANLLLARATQRQREFAVRAALGAGRGRIVRQLVTESALLTLLGAVGGLALAHGGVALIAALGSASLPRVEAIAIDRRVLAFTVVVAVATALFFGLAPALHFWRPNLHDALKEGGRAASWRFLRNRMRTILVAAQVALALVLLIGSGLLVRSFVGLLRVDPGFARENRFSLQLFLWEQQPTPERRAQFVTRLFDEMRALPGVRSVGAVSALPFHEHSIDIDGTFTIEGRSIPAPGEEPSAYVSFAAGDYFGTMGIPLRRGRHFVGSDGRAGTPVAVINETMARRYWPDGDPIGAKIAVRGFGNVVREVVGVVGDVRHAGLDRGPRPEIFIPHAQFPFASMTFVVRTAADPLPLIAAAKERVWALERAQPIYHVATLEELIAKSLTERRFHLTLLGAFSAIALLLSAVGVYGLVSFSIGQRTHEIGIRMALGARAGDIVRMTMRQGLLLTLAGIAAGVAGALALTRVLRGMLFGVAPTDPGTFAALAALLLAVAAVACYVPARRAARVDPLRAIRAE